MSTQNYDQYSEEQGNEFVEQNRYNAEQARKYNKQSNLYDPQGKTYTPSGDEPDDAKQIDASAIEQRKKDDPFAPLFDNLDEQLEATRRQPGGEQGQLATPNQNEPA